MIISDISSEKFFYVHDGSVVKNLQELPEVLRSMSPQTFQHHVNSEKNDFYNWTKDVFNHASLARRIKSSKTKESMAKTVFMELYS